MSHKPSESSNLNIEVLGKSENIVVFDICDIFMTIYDIHLFPLVSNLNLGVSHSRIYFLFMLNITYHVVRDGSASCLVIFCLVVLTTLFYFVEAEQKKECLV